MKEETLRKKAEEYQKRFSTELGNEWEQLTEFKGSHEPVTAIHKPCGELRTAPARDFFRRGCVQCERMKARKARVDSSIAEYIRKITEKYSVTPKSEYVGMRVPMLWKCNHCGAHMEKTVENILFRKGDWGGGILCDCRIERNKANQSVGTLRIIKYLRDHGIPYMREKTYDSCRDVRPLPFDFVILKPDRDVKCVIEHDGAQHFFPIESWGGEEKLMLTRRHDKIKTEWCEKNGLPLLRVRYDANIEEEIETFLNNL